MLCQFEINLYPMFVAYIFNTFTDALCVGYENMILVFFVGYVLLEVLRIFVLLCPALKELSRGPST